MEITWKVFNLCPGLLFFGLCNGLPINLENTTADSHTQLLTGLVAVLLTVCSVVFLAGCLCCQRANRFKEFRDSPVVASASSNLDHGHVNPVTNGEFTIFTPLSPPHHNNNVFLANQQTIIRTQDDYVYGDVDVSSWFNGNEKEFPRIKLKYIKELGKGWFGRVVEGAAQNINDQPWTQVVVRILDSTASSRERVVFLHDAAIYRCGNHPNILQLFGRCLDTVPLLLLQEFCPQGDLKNYLRENKQIADKLLSTEYPLVWCCQLTSALKHLHNHKLIHPDLATRNCQLTSNLTLKLGDYGLAVFRYPEDYYQGAPGVPVRWCSPESLTYTNTTIQPKKITSEANIWSLGVTLWEICECGELPYTGLTDDEVISQVLGPPKVRLPRPTHNILYTDYIYRLMQLCWTTSESRPAISQVDLMLADLLQVHRNTTSSKSEPPVSCEDFDRRWESFKPNTIVKSDNRVSEIADTKQLSLSLNNLHGSLDDLSENDQMESWLENVATKTGDMSFVKGLSDAIKDLDDTIASENIASPINFKLGPNSTNNNSLLLYSQRAGSSGSETEDENWKKKVERGVYSEKVRLKSKSVQDLMVLTHIDCSESDPETPLASLDYRINNYKNVRLAGPKENLESVSFVYGSEGNLLNVKDTFKEELRKLQEERRDSLLFVPDKSSQNNNNNNTSDKSNLDDSSNRNFLLEDSPSKRILHELNSTTEIKPANQIYNVFSVTIDKYSPVRCNSDKLSEIINNLKRAEESNSQCARVPKLSDIIQNNTDLATILSTNFESKKEDRFDKEYDESGYQSNEKLDADDRKNAQDLLGFHGDPDHHQVVPVSEHQLFKLGTVPETIFYEDDRQMVACLEEEQFEMFVPETNLVETEANDTEETANFCSSTVDDCLDNDQFQAPVPEESTKIACVEESSTCNTVPDEEKHQQSGLDFPSETAVPETKEANNTEETANFCSSTVDDCLDNDQFQAPVPEESTKITCAVSCLPITEEVEQSENSSIKEHGVEEIFFQEEKAESVVLYQVPKLVDIIQNNDSLLDFIIAHYDCDSDLSLSTAQDAPDCDDAEFLSDEKNITGFCNSNGESTITVNQDEDFAPVPKVAFDLSEHQEESKANSLTHSKVVQEGAPDTSEKYSSLNLFVGCPDLDEELQTEKSYSNLNLKYSLETWDNFLGKALDDSQSESQNLDQMFDSFSSEPQSLLFLEHEKPDADLDATFTISNEELVEDEVCDTTFTRSDNEGWEEGGGWFLHPRSGDEDVSGEMVAPQKSDDSYVGFCSMDDEIMAAIRNELLIKLPHAQGSSSQVEREEEDADFAKQNMIHMKYNIFKMPLSPIEEESEFEESSGENTPRLEETYSVDSDWSEDDDDDIVVEEEEEVGAKETVLADAETNTLESPARGQLHRHTPSQDSCCSNDTLFNLEELNCADKTNAESPKCESSPSSESTPPPEAVREGDGDCLGAKSGAPATPNNSESNTTDSVSSDNLLPFPCKQAAPLPSPEDKPWKQLPACQLSYDKIFRPQSDNEEPIKNNEPVYENLPEDVYNEADYVNLVNLENCKNRAELPDKEQDFEDGLIMSNEDGEDFCPVLTDIRFNGPSDGQLMSTSFSESNDLNDEQDWDSGSDTRSSSSGEFIWKEGEHEESLKALRAAPQDLLEQVEPMDQIEEETSSEGSTCTDEDAETPEFVPSAWDKYATPTKSALRSPEKTSKKEPKGVCFKKQKYLCVYEYPREPDSPVLHGYDLFNGPALDYSTFAEWEFDTDYAPATADESEPSRNYYRPNANRKANLYQLTCAPDFPKCAQGGGALDDEFYISSTSKPFHMLGGLSSQFFPGNSWFKTENVTPDSGIDDSTPADESFTNHPLNYPNAVQSLKTLASAVLDKEKQQKNKKNGDVLGGLRHTRDKLKLDLPASPSAFTSSKMFTLEQSCLDPVVCREKPSFTTFGKSRFLVQHVDTPTDTEETQSKNVSFEALPYKPPACVAKEEFDDDSSKGGKIEIVRGEASLLDSADEDSGIESSTLERKLSCSEC